MLCIPHCCGDFLPSFVLKYCHSYFHICSRLPGAIFSTLFTEQNFPTWNSCKINIRFHIQHSFINMWMIYGSQVLCLKPSWPSIDFSRSAVFLLSQFFFPWIKCKIFIHCLLFRWQLECFKVNCMFKLYLFMRSIILFNALFFFWCNR